MPRLFHLADIHLSTAIGPQTFSPEIGTPVHRSVIDVLAALDRVAELARESRPDAILIAGDTYHRIVNSRAVMAALARRLRTFSEIAPVVLVIGNHDQASYTSHLFLDYQQFTIPNLYIVDSPRHVLLTARDGTQLDLFCLGWPSQPPDGEGSKHESLSAAAERRRRELHEWVNRVVADGAKTAAPNACRVLVAHGLVRNAYAAGEMPVDWMKEDCVLEDESLEGYDYAALGHIHLRRVYRQRVVYPGSLYPASFGEAGWPHGFADVIVEPGSVPQVRFHDLEVRPYANLALKASQTPTVDQAVAALAASAAPSPETFLRIHLVIDTPESELNSAALLAAIGDRYGYIVIDRTDTGAIPQNDLPAMSLEESLTVYLRRFMEQNDIEPDLRLRAMIRLRTLLASA